MMSELVRKMHDVSPMAAKILSVLVIEGCAEGLTFEYLIERLQASKSTLSTNINFLLDKGLIYYLMAVIKHQLLTGSLQEAGFEDLLDQDFETYYETAKSQLNPYRDRHQLKELENLRQSLYQALNTQ